MSAPKPVLLALLARVLFGAPLAPAFSILTDELDCGNLHSLRTLPLRNCSFSPADNNHTSGDAAAPPVVCDVIKGLEALPTLISYSDGIFTRLVLAPLAAHGDTRDGNSTSAPRAGAGDNSSTVKMCYGLSHSRTEKLNVASSRSNYTEIPLAESLQLLSILFNQYVFSLRFPSSVPVAEVELDRGCWKAGDRNNHCIRGVIILEDLVRGDDELDPNTEEDEYWNSLRRVYIDLLGGSIDYLSIELRNGSKIDDSYIRTVIGAFDSVSLFHAEIKGFSISEVGDWLLPILKGFHILKIESSRMRTLSVGKKGIISYNSNGNENQAITTKEFFWQKIFLRLVLKNNRSKKILGEKLHCHCTQNRNWLPEGKRKRENPISLFKRIIPQKF